MNMVGSVRLCVLTLKDEAEARGRSLHLLLDTHGTKAQDLWVRGGRGVGFGSMEIGTSWGRTGVSRELSS